MWQVQLMGVPADADVQIDGTLHPERPILVPEAPGARTVEVIAADHAVWKKEVAIHADLTLHVTLEKSSPPRPEPVPDPGPLKKEKAEKTVKGTKQKGDPDPKDEKKNKIDIVYPGMKK
jgi:hypothetical protein